MQSVSFSKWQLILKGRGGKGKDDIDLHSLQLEHECFCPRFQVNLWDWPPIEGPWL